MSFVGKIFGNLTVVYEFKRDDGRKSCGCICSCGNEAKVRTSFLISGNTKSCGCLKKIISTKRLAEIDNVTHGMTKKSAYFSWKSMKQRCLNPKSPNFHTHGGRGIKICEQWVNSFENFIKDLGEKPKGTSIERLDNDGNYEPGNCVWATPKQQGNNRRTCRVVTINETSMNITQWCESLGLKRKTVNERLRRGWSEKKALGFE